MRKVAIVCQILFLLNFPAYGESDQQQAFFHAGEGCIPNDVVSWKDDPFLIGYDLDKFTTYGDFINFMRSFERRLLPADDWDTSSYMIGTVSGSVILPESMGGSEDWTAEEIAQVHQEVENGIRWWAEQELGAHLNFIFNYEDSVSIVDEPITQPGINWWLLHTMQVLGYGYENYGGTQYWIQGVYDYVNNQRTIKNADWGFVVYIVDSSNDVDGEFSNGLFAFATQDTHGGGPYLVMTYDNAGWGINNMDAICAHETGHIFGAKDQYESSGCLCTTKAGYLFYENQNCANSCLINEPSIMKNNYPYVFANNLIDYYARGQLGWGDSNSNGIMDIIDFEPAISCTYSGLEGNEFVISGNASTDWLEPINPYYHTVKINQIAGVEYSVNDGEWGPAIPTDGSYDSLYEEYGVRYTITGAGDYSFKVRAVDRFGEHTSEENYYETSLIITDANDIVAPQLVSLSQNYPNPFNPSTTITYYLPEDSSVQLEIFDVSGKRIALLINELQEKGQHVTEWNGRDLYGNSVGSGLYFYRLKAGEEIISRKLALIR